MSVHTRNSLTIHHINRDDDYEKIIEYLDADDKTLVTLPEGLQSKIFRVLTADALFERYKTTKRVKEILKKRFGYSDSTAQRDIKDCQEVFGLRKKSNKEYKRQLYITWFEDLAKKAENAQDFKAAASLLDKAAKLHGFDKEEPLDDELLEAAPSFILSYDLESLGVEPIENLNAELKKFKYEQKLKQLDVDDVEEEL